MSNVLLSKLKNVETNRAELEEILNTKGVPLYNNSLGSLVNKVNLLHYNEEPEPEWDGVPDEEVPTDYYQGQGLWKDLVDIDTIMEADTYNYDCKVFFLIRCSENLQIDSSINTGSCFSGFTAFRYSDNPNTVVTNTNNHTWNKANDIVNPSNHERFRWIVAYRNKSTSSYLSLGNHKCYWNSTYFLPEAVVYWQGDFPYLVIQSYETTASGIYYYNQIDQGWVASTSSGTCYLGSSDCLESTFRYNTICQGNNKACKYFRATENVRTYFTIGNPDSTDDRLRTCILDCEIKQSINIPSSSDLEYVRIKNYNYEQFYYKNTIFTSYSSDLNDGICPIKLANNIFNKNYRTYYDIQTEFNVNVRGFSNCNNVYLKMARCLNTGRFNNNNNCSVKINKCRNIVDCKDNPKLYMEIDECKTIESNCFDAETRKSTYIKINKCTGTIGSYAFRACKNAYYKLICEKEEGDTSNYSVGQVAFSDSSITYLDLGKSNITSIACTDSNPHDNTYYNYFAFSGSNITYLVLPPITTLNKYLVSPLSKLEYLEITSGTTTLSEYLCYYCYKLKQVILSETITSIGQYCFYDNYSLEYININLTNITTINQYCFYGCMSLQTITLPDSLTTINQYAFSRSGLQTITLPDRLTTINQYAFEYCLELSTINQNNSGLLTLGQQAFGKCESLTSIDISKVTSMGNFVFYYCENMNLTIPEHITANMNANSLADTVAQILIPQNIVADTDIQVNGARWNIKTFLKFLESLPDRTGLTQYRVDIGNDIDYTQAGSTTETYIFYNYVKNGYVKEVDDELVYSDTQEDSTWTKVSNYVAAKNWALT